MEIVVIMIVIVKQYMAQIGEIIKEKLRLFILKENHTFMLLYHVYQI